MRLQHGSFLRPSMIGPCVSVLKRSDADHQCPEGVTGGKAASEDSNLWYRGTKAAWHAYTK